MPSARGGNSPALRGCADGLAATIIIATLLARAQWDVVPHVIVSGWLLYTLIVSAQRCALVRQYWRASPSGTVNGRWNAAFVAGAALAAVGWGVGALVLYPADRSINEFVVVYAVGGVMLGSVSLLAARPEASSRSFSRPVCSRLWVWPSQAMKTTSDHGSSGRSIHGRDGHHNIGAV